MVVIGGGFGGVRAVQAMEDAPAEITLIDRTNHHLFQPLLYQVATRVLSAGQVAPALRSMFRRQKNVRVLLGRVSAIDLEPRVVTMIADKTNEIPYDTLVVATGATHSYLGHEEWGQIALLAHRVLRGEYRKIDPAKAQVILFDATPNLLGAFPASLSERGEPASAGDQSS